MSSRRIPKSISRIGSFRDGLMRRFRISFGVAGRRRREVQERARASTCQGAREAGKPPAEGKKKRPTEGQSIHVFRDTGIHDSCLRHRCALSLCFTRSIHDWASHQTQETFAVFVVFRGDSDETSREFVDLLLIPCVLSFLQIVLSLGSSFSAFVQLHSRPPDRTQSRPKSSAALCE